MTFTSFVLKGPGECCGPARGFTLIELLVTIVVLSILLSLAVPAFRTFMQNDQQWTQQNNLILAPQYRPQRGDQGGSPWRRVGVRQHWHRSSAHM